MSTFTNPVLHLANEESAAPCRPDAVGSAAPTKPDRFALQAELNRQHNLGLRANIRGGWQVFNHACFEVRRRLLGIDGPTSWGGSREETQARLIRKILGHREYPSPRLP